MPRKILLAATLMVLSALLAPGVWAAPELQSAHVNLRDQASLQRGASLYMNYCAGCHSLGYLRYSRLAEDLGLTEDEVMQNLNFTGGKYQEPILAAMTHADGEQWFGKAPPDLSLEVRAKGADWVYSYLHSFYVDPSRPVGWNNTVFPNASMPNVLAPLQGVQEARDVKGDEVGSLELVQTGSLTPAQFDAAVRDLTAFMQYASEPAALQRTRMGIWVLLYLVLFTIVAWALKKEFWKDVH